MKTEVMKKICVSLIMTAAVLISFCQVQYPGLQNMLSRHLNENGQTFYRNVSISQLDSNEQYKYIRDGFVLQEGQLKLVRNGNLYRQDSPVTLKNGTIIMTDGLIKMTNGSTPLLKENDFVDMDGNIRPLQKLTNYYSF
jgi:hypothetical protein